jgi:hypothetical protein
MKFKVDRIISVATLFASLIAIVLVLKRPAPMAEHQASAPVAVSTQSSDPRLTQVEPASQPSQGSQQAPPVNVVTVAGSPTAGSATQQPAPTAAAQGAKAEARGRSDEISAVLSQTLGAAAGGLSNLSPDSNLGSAAPNIKDQQVSVEGDVVHGKFLTEIAGKDVWVTVSGHMGEKDGYATFDPTEFKVGDVEVPVSLVNPVLQQKLAEERDRLKLPQQK